MTPRHIPFIAVAALLAFTPFPSLAQDGTPGKTPDQLLREIQQGHRAESQEAQAREAEFRRNRDAARAAVAAARQERDREAARASQLEETFRAKERELAALEQQKLDAQGSLGELFGVVRQIAGDTRGVIDGSYVTNQFPGRSSAVDQLARSREVPSLAELRQLWASIFQEMVESGKVVRYTGPVVTPEGVTEERSIVRVGAFNAVSDGRFLVWKPETQQLQDLPEQPLSRHLSNAEAVSEATTGPVAMSIDPSRGEILRRLVDTPDAGERIGQGGFVGYVIIGLGILGVLILLERLVVLLRLGGKMRRQVNSSEASSDNPLGRVMKVYTTQRTADVETLELKLDEAIIKETPAIERGLTTLQVLSVIAPLLGLLGTVTGMINTFQQITLFGAGDPTLMASGISQALVTTMLGLIMAIPLVLFHSLLRDKSRGLIQILEEQAAGMIAARAEKGTTA